MTNSFLAFFGLTSAWRGAESRIIHRSSVGIPPSATFGDPADGDPGRPSLIGVFLDIWTTWYPSAGRAAFSKASAAAPLAATVTNTGLTGTRGPAQSPHVTGGGGGGGFSFANSRRSCSVPVAASVRFMLSSRSLTSLSPSAGLIPACAQAAAATLSPTRLPRPSGQLARLFRF